ncbi:TRAP transporter small permease subunit [Stutzerimonas azotifigens]|uniref:TRAP transporter small permease subunit n=1 Tax=Stutzerimonas azotifigens TaxID=291995 RepID=UPI0004063FE6|nr:TRAP transporter small permease subunit [Stutzerimonas azotifigens]
MGNLIRLYVHQMDQISRWVGLVAMNLVFVLIGVLLLSAIARNLIDIPLHWCIEFAQFTLAAYYFAGGAYSLNNDSHVRMDLIYSHLSDKAKARLDVLTDLCLMFFLTVLLIGSISSTRYAIETNQRNFSIWNPSMVPIKVIMVCAIVLMLMQALSIFFKDVAKARGAHL